MARVRASSRVSAVSKPLCCSHKGKSRIKNSHTDFLRQKKKKLCVIYNRCALSFKLFYYLIYYIHNLIHWKEGFTLSSGLAVLSLLLRNCDCFRNTAPPGNLLVWQLCSLINYSSTQKSISTCCDHTDKQEHFRTVFKWWVRNSFRGGGEGGKKISKFHLLCCTMQLDVKTNCSGDAV